MDEIRTRAARLLGALDGAACVESSTGVRRSRTPALRALSATVKAFGALALVSLADCSVGIVHQGGAYGIHAGFDQSQTGQASNGYDQQQGYQPGYQQGQGGIVQTSTIAGAVAGGFIGNNVGSHHGRVLKTIAGTLIGAGIGNSIGQSLSQPQYVAPQQEGYYQGGMIEQGGVSQGPGYGATPGYYGGVYGNGGQGNAYADQQNLQRNLATIRIGQEFDFTASNGDRGRYVPIRDYTDDNGRACREYTGTVLKAGSGRVFQGHGYSCQQQDGSYVVVGSADRMDDHKFAEAVRRIGGPAPAADGPKIG